MARTSHLELPGRVVTKIQKILGIQPSDLQRYDLVSLIEDLCDTALMFDREEPGIEPRTGTHPSKEVIREGNASTPPP